MKRLGLLAAIGCVALVGNTVAAPTPVDPRLREVVYDAHAVVTVPVKRGVVTLVVLDGDESIVELAAGLGGDCAKPEAPWCVAAQAGGRNFFVKAKSSATAPNNIAAVTNRRTHVFRFVVLADSDPKPPIYRLVVKAPAREAPAARDAVSTPVLATGGAVLSLREVVAERLTGKPQVINTQYSVADGAGSQDIVPTLVFDDGRFTYLRFPGNREVPAVFHVLPDGSETLVNARMEDDLLVLDRVSRRMVLRAGSAVVGLVERGLRCGRQAARRRHHGTRRSASSSGAKAVRRSTRERKPRHDA